MTLEQVMVDLGHAFFAFGVVTAMWGVVLMLSGMFLGRFRKGK